MKENKSLILFLLKKGNEPRYFYKTASILKFDDYVFLRRRSKKLPGSLFLDFRVFALLTTRLKSKTRHKTVITTRIDKKNIVVNFLVNRIIKF